jgi:chromate reductase
VADTIRILGIPGSLRRASYNRRLLHAAQELAPEDVEIELFELHDLPHYDGDVEAQGDPEPVAEFKDAIRDADALLIATPEYNRGIPGVLKNAIDWASRPPFGSPLTNKPVAVMGTSPGMGGTRKAQQQVRDALAFSKAETLTEPEVALPQSYERFDDDGRLDDPEARAAVAALVDALAEVALRRRVSLAEVAA